MHILKMMTIVAGLMILSGCSTTLTSIKPGDKPNEFYVTEIMQGPYVLKGRFYQCEANGNQEMICTRE